MIGENEVMDKIVHLTTHTTQIKSDATVKFVQLKIESDRQITIYGIKDENLTARGLENKDKIFMINRIMPTDVENAWELLQEKTIELVVTKTIGSGFRQIFNYASPFGSLRTIHDSTIHNSII